jgi:hypothetical protein
VGKAVFRPMIGVEIRAALALGACSFTPGCFDKRFSRGLAGEACTTKKITDKQAVLLWELVHRYRRQISDAELLDIAKAVKEGVRAPGVAPLFEKSTE